VSEASPWVRRFAGLVPAGAAVLDLACGSGRHARFFAARGCRVLALDRDPACAASFASVPNVDFMLADLEGAPWPLAQRRFAAIVVTNYLHRPLFARLPSALEPGGVLLYETFAVGQERYGRPANPDFLLRPGELLEAFASSLRIVAYEDGTVGDPVSARLQRLCAMRLGAERGVGSDAPVTAALDAPSGAPPAQ